MKSRDLLRTAVSPLLLAGLLTLLAYAATGATTGFFFAGIVIATLLTPPLVVAETTRRAQLLSAASLVAGIVSTWLLALSDPLIHFIDWLRAGLVLAGYALALCGVTALLSRVRRFPPSPGAPGEGRGGGILRRIAHEAPTPARERAVANSARFPRSTGRGGRFARESTASATLVAAAVIVLALLWLSWPIWLSPWIAGHERLVGMLTPAHPLLALDSLFRATGPPWSERYYMYNLLSVLNQDVPYELPRSILPAVLLHALVGGAALLLSGLGARPVRLEIDVPDRGAGGAGEQSVREDLAP